MIELTKEQAQNLLVFLQRVEMKGSEVQAWAQIVSTLTEGLKKQVEVKEEKKK